MPRLQRSSSTIVLRSSILVAVVSSGACAAPTAPDAAEPEESTGSVSSELAFTSVLSVKGGAPGYTIPVGNGLCLEAQPNATVLQARCAISNPMQRWVTLASGAGTTIRSAGNNRCLNVVGGPAINSSVNTATCTGATNQRFHVYANGGAFETTMTPGLAAIGSRVVADGSALCLDLRGGTANGGEMLQLFNCHGGANQALSIKGGPVAITTVTGSFGDEDHVAELRPGSAFPRIRLGPGERVMFDTTPNISWISFDATSSSGIFHATPGTIQCPVGTTVGHLIRIPDSDDYRMTCMR